MIFFIKYDIINGEINSQNFMELYYILIENSFFNNKINNLQKKNITIDQKYRLNFMFMINRNVMYIIKAKSHPTIILQKLDTDICKNHSVF